jgi:aminoglycoside phosphotransferase (APT) family kinase protein
VGDDFAGAVARICARHGLTDAAAVGAGVESQVLSAESRQWGRVAVKLPLRDLSSPVSLLHLDVRSVNIIWDAPGRPKLIDWTNSLLGPPQLELARLPRSGTWAPAA